MNTRAIFLTILIVVTLITLLFYYRDFSKSELGIKDYVTDDAIAVLELNAYDQLLNYDYITDLLQLTQDEPLLELISDSILLTNIGSENFLISVHSVSNTDFGLTFYLNVRDPSIQKAFVSLNDSLQSLFEVQRTVRTYDGKEIYEGSYSNLSYSYLLDDSFIIISKHPFLVEDVIRLINDKDEASFISANFEIMEMPKLTNDEGNFYINLNQFPKLLNLISTDQSGISVTDFAENSFFDVSMSQFNFNLNGFTNVNSSDYLGTFINQEPAVDPFNKYIPNNSSYAEKHLVDNPQQWLLELNNYWSSTAPNYLIERSDFKNNYELDPANIFNNIKNGYCKVGFNDRPEAENIIFISIKDINETLSSLNQLSENLSTIDNDSVFVEKYGDYFISELRIKDFPRHVLGPNASGFEQTYYITMNDMLIIGNTIEVLKDLILSIENEDTWGRSKAYNSFFESGLAELNYSISWNIHRLWPAIVSNLNADWKEFVQENTNYFKGFKLGMAQFSRIDENYYTNIDLTYEKTSTNNIRKYYKPEYQLIFTDPLVIKPYVVRNHNTNRLETIVQDSLANLALIGVNGQKLWNTYVGSAVTSPIGQVDFYKNGKLQYFFTTKNKLHILDRLGNYIENYPIETNFDISEAAIIDYDKSKNYRFLLTDDRGDIYLLNKQGELLDGWSPHIVGTKLSAKPFHLRIRARDCFIYQTIDGKLNAVNRRGEPLKNFPLELDGKFNSKIFVEKGTDFKSTKLHLMSTSGLKIQVNMEGEIVSNEELYKQSKEAQFKIIPDALGKTYIIARKERNRLVILDSEKNEIMSKDYPGTLELLIQYYYFNPENQVYAVTDTVQGFTYLYRADGSLINNQPINSDYEVGILYSEVNNEYTIYKIHNDTFSVLKF